MANYLCDFCCLLWLVFTCVTFSMKKQQVVYMSSILVCADFLRLIATKIRRAKNCKKKNIKKKNKKECVSMQSGREKEIGDHYNLSQHTLSIFCSIPLLESKKEEEKTTICPQHTLSIFCSAPRKQKKEEKKRQRVSTIYSVNILLCSSSGEQKN